MSKILRNFDKYTKKLEQAAKKACEDFEKSVKDEIIEITPKDTGALRESYDFGELESPDYIVNYSFSFGAGLVGDDGLPYAGQMHEYSENANWTTPGTGPDFLIKPVYANADDFKRIYALNARRIKL